MLKCSTSLWSADLADLAAEIKRVEPFTDRFHLDVADGHYAPNLVFFPDLVKALRPHTRLPFEVHLMVADPLAWLQAFIEAGADIVIVCHDAIPDPRAVLRAIKQRGRRAGLSLRVEEPVAVAEPHLAEVDVLCVMGTKLGVKGATMDAAVPEKIRHARTLIRARGLATEIEADGGIRRATVPLLKAAGADFIVPGSLMFREDPRLMRDWLNSL